MEGPFGGKEWPKNAVKFGAAWGDPKWQQLPNLCGLGGGFRHKWQNTSKFGADWICGAWSTLLAKEADPKRVRPKPEGCTTYATTPNFGARLGAASAKQVRFRV